MQGRRGGLVATLALARKLAALDWRLMVQGMKDVEQGLATDAVRVAETEQRRLRLLAKKHGLVRQPKAA